MTVLVRLNAEVLLVVRFINMINAAIFHALWTEKC